MGEELSRSLALLAERGTPRGAVDVLDAARRDADPSVPPARPTWRRGLAVALGAAAAVLVLIGAAILATRPFGGEETPPVGTEPPVVVTTSPQGRQPEALAPTGVRLLTYPSNYEHVVLDPFGFIWAGGGGVARLDPVTGESRVWTQSDGDTFGEFRSLAPARGGGVWMILEDGSLRWFDGDLFRALVEAPPLASDRDQVAAVVETADGTLLASTFEGGVFGWDGSSWSRIEDARPVTGAGALAIDADGTIWVGNAELALVEEQEDWGIQREWRPLGRGVSRYDGERWETFTSDDAAALAGLVLTIEPLSDGTAWVGTEAGLAHFDGVSWTEFDLSQIGLRGETFATVGPDGTVWVATDAGAGGGEGVAGFDGTTWTVYGPGDGLPDAGAGSRPIATDDGVFVGTGAGLFHLVGDNWIKVPLSPEPTAPPAAPGTPTVLAGIAGTEASSDSLWAWGQDEIWRYTGGEWSEYSSTPSAEANLAHDGDTFWALAEDGLWYLEGSAWQRVSAARPGPYTAAIDARSGIVWMSTGEDLYRWDGEEMTNVGHPWNFPDSDWGYVGGVVVTEDGSVWASGLNPWVPDRGGLARYDDTAGSWETVRPADGDEDVPAWSMATAPDGGLWVVLSKWALNWGLAPLPEWALAHRDGATGEWTVYDDGLPEGFPGLMAADDDGVWLGRGSVGNFEPFAGILRFDGEAWTHYLADIHVTDPIDDIAVAPDGTIWYTQNDVLRQLEP